MILRYGRNPLQQYTTIFYLHTHSDQVLISHEEN